MTKQIPKVSYAFPVFRNGLKQTVILWNGVKDYECAPIPEHIAQVNLGGLVLSGHLGITQVRKPPRSMVKLVSDLVDEFDCVILWARNTKVYERMRDELRLSATHKWDGTRMVAN